MQLTPRALQILRLIRRFKFVDRALVQRCYFPRDKDGSVTREFLRKLVNAGYARRLRAEVADPHTTSTAPVYVPTETGCSMLAQGLDNPDLFLDALPNTRAWTSLRHWVCLSDLLVTIEQALATQSVVCCPRMILEHDVANAEATEPRERFRLYTEVRPAAVGTRRLVCVPDAAFELTVGSVRRAYYVELERCLDSANRVAASKCGGYQGLFESRLFQRHFPGVQDFRVLAVCDGRHWRDRLRAAVAKKPGAERWLFATRQDLTGTAFLHAPVLFGCTGEGQALLRPAPPSTPQTTPPTSPAPVATGGVLRGVRR